MKFTFAPRSSHWWLLAAPLVALMIGCESRSPVEETPGGAVATAPGQFVEEGQEDEQETEEPQADQSQVTLEVADREKYDEVIASHRGDIVLVDFWATWCPPCREQFPHTVELSRKHADQGFSVVSVSFDDPEASFDQAKAFLEDQNAAFDNLISQYGASPESAQEFGVSDGAVPHYKLYDRQGELVESFSNPEDLAEIDKRVEELLAQPQN